MKLTILRLFQFHVHKSITSFFSAPSWSCALRKRKSRWSYTIKFLVKLEEITTETMGNISFQEQQIVAGSNSFWKIENLSKINLAQRVLQYQKCMKKDIVHKKFVPSGKTVFLTSYKNIPVSLRYRKMVHRVSLGITYTATSTSKFFLSQKEFLLFHSSPIHLI